PRGPLLDNRSAIDYNLSREGSPSSGGAAVSVQAALTGLARDTTYHFPVDRDEQPRHHGWSGRHLHDADSGPAASGEEGHGAEGRRDAAYGRQEADREGPLSGRQDPVQERSQEEAQPRPLAEPEARQEAQEGCESQPRRRPRQALAERPRRSSGKSWRAGSPCISSRNGVRSCRR